TSGKLTNLLRDSAYSPEAIGAYKKFLAGEPLQEAAVAPATGLGGGEAPDSLRPKMEQIQASVQKLRQAGRDPSPVWPVMLEVRPLMQQGKFKEAEAAL